MKIFSTLLITVLSITTNIFSQVQFTPHNITFNAPNVYDIYAADIDGDGDIDILSALYIANEIYLYENDGHGNFTELLISTEPDGPTSIYAFDVDTDGDMDVLTTSSRGGNEVSWYENDGDEIFTRHIISTNASNCVFAIDVDGDGDADVLASSGINDILYWYENDGNENFTHHTIMNGVNLPRSLFAIDVDGDTDIDVLAASLDQSPVAWYENDGNQTFTEHAIATDTDGGVQVYAVDMDSDGDIDVLSASHTGLQDKITWYENDGDENFTTHIITMDADYPTSVYAADIDGDSDIDVLSASRDDNTIAWYENDGNENFTTHIISTQAVIAVCVLAGDVDGDGDTDVLSASALDSELNWYENLSVTSIELISTDIPLTFSLSQNYPNPFNPSTKISWQSPVGSHQTLKVYDVLGNEVATLVDEFREAGRYEIEFNASNLSSGIYFYKLQAENFVETKKMVLLQ